jgi:hypothetical protein
MVVMVVALATDHARARQTPAVVPTAVVVSWTHPRTAWGDPDLESVWTSDNNFSIPLERPAEVADKEFLDGKELKDALARRAKMIAAVGDGGGVGAGPSHWYENLTAKSQRSSLIIDPRNGRLPALTAAARARCGRKRGAQGPRSGGLVGGPESVGSLHYRGTAGGHVPDRLQQQRADPQAPGYVTITHEMMHDTRVIPLDGRPHLSPRIRQYMGDSRARWEGTTLVIDVTNFHPNTICVSLFGRRRRHAARNRVLLARSPSE